MGKTADYSNTKKYSDKKSFDGTPVEDGKVLVPFLRDKFHLRSGEYIDDNFTTMHLGEFKYPIGFMAIREDKYAEYMRDFWDEVHIAKLIGRVCGAKRPHSVSEQPIYIVSL